MNIKFKDHGGDCCGITHIYNFSDDGCYYSTKSLEAEWKQVVDYLENRYGDMHCGGTHVFEIVLTDEQLNMNNKFFKKKLEEKGFQLVNSFVNANTDNKVNIFHYSPEEKDHDDDYDYSWS